MKKYGFTQNSIEIDNRTLYQIRTRKDFGSVKPESMRMLMSMEILRFMNMSTSPEILKSLEMFKSMETLKMFVSVKTPRPL